MEGSLRVPFIIRWPGRIPAGRVSNEIVHEVDTFTTFAAIAGTAALHCSFVMTSLQPVLNVN